MKKMTTQGLDIYTFKHNEKDFISLTDIARYKNAEFPADVIKNWIRTRNTLEFLGIWERINNPRFKLVEFDGFIQGAGANSFVLSPQKWIDKTNALGLISRSGNGGGTFAHKDIAFEFASWVSAEFKFYLIKEFQRLKEEENEKLILGWDAKRMLTKINYRIHTDAVKKHLVPAQVSKTQTNALYANEADVLNTALFGMTAKEWRDQHPKQKGNIRDSSDVAQLICLANLESLNAEFIRQGLTQSIRLRTLNEIAIIQMTSLLDHPSVKKLQ